ncbi:hypothetical protein COCNU_scaffold008160G000020 [Cocos nucifera]|nr:hypothetical protein [Cocos nucifera]
MAEMGTHRKPVNKGEDKLLELPRKVSKISELEKKMKELEGKEYKSSEDFIKEVTEASVEAFDSGFNSCKDLVEKLFSNLDLSGITEEAGLILASKMEARPTSEVDATAKILASIPASTEVISLEDDPVVVVLIEAPQVNKGEDKLLELPRKVSKISELEKKMKELEGKEYKSSEDFIKEVTEASVEAFDSGFNSCKDLVEKLFSNLDLSGITEEAGLILASKMEARPTSEVDATAKILASIPASTEVISLEDDPVVVVLIEAPQVDA